MIDWYYVGFRISVFEFWFLIWVNICMMFVVLFFGYVFLGYLKNCFVGLKIGLVEKFDFFLGISSRSIKLIYGGVRYL